MSDEVEDRLAAVRAERAALAEAAATRLQPTPDEQLATEERALKEDQAFDSFAREHGARSVAIIRTEAGAVILRRPHIAAFRKFQDAGGLTSDTAEELVKASLLYPSKPELDKILRLLPGILTSLASTCVELSGFRNLELKAK